MIKIHRFVFNPFAENTYILWDDTTLEAAIIDPGCYEEFEKNLLKDFVASNKLTPKYLLNTHCHIDHIVGNAFIKKEFIVEFIAGEKDVFLLEIQLEHAYEFGFEMEESPQPDSFLSEDRILRLGEQEIKSLFTPGHSPGEFCLYCPDENICITGDVLFNEAIGRTDLWSGDYKNLIQSIQVKLFTLPDETKIYPGHGDESSIGYEKIHNPFL
ncbi:MAG: MBL fold metallo-hydrolase [Ignavibacteriales bacterium]|nr:MAG: MBL fold metallo-hydrolase [Ignavibacteriales bacterium]